MLVKKNLGMYYYYSFFNVHVLIGFKYKYYSKWVNDFFEIVDAADITLTAAGDIQGGGTGGEFLGNLLMEGTENWNKWVHPHAVSSLVEAEFSSPRALFKYGIQSANDFPERDPQSFDFYGREVGSTEWVLLDSVRTCPFSKRWEWFERSATIQGKPNDRDAPVLFTAAKLVINAPRRVGDGIQLGGMRFYAYRDEIIWRTSRIPFEAGDPGVIF